MTQQNTLYSDLDFLTFPKKDKRGRQSVGRTRIFGEGMAVASVSFIFDGEPWRISSTNTTLLDADPRCAGERAGFADEATDWQADICKVRIGKNCPWQWSICRAGSMRENICGHILKIPALQKYLVCLVFYPFISFNEDEHDCRFTWRAKSFFNILRPATWNSKWKRIMGQSIRRVQIL